MESRAHVPWQWVGASFLLKKKKKKAYAHELRGAASSTWDNPHTPTHSARHAPLPSPSIWKPLISWRTRQHQVPRLGERGKHGAWERVHPSMKITKCMRQSKMLWLRIDRPRPRSKPHDRIFCGSHCLFVTGNRLT